MLAEDNESGSFFFFFFFNLFLKLVNISMQAKGCDICMPSPQCCPQSLNNEEMHTSFTKDTQHSIKKVIIVGCLVGMKIVSSPAQRVFRFF